MRPTCIRESGGQSCLEFIPDLIKDCLENHPRCGQQDDFRLPSRVVDVGDIQNNKHPFLYETNGKTGRYICLSHCWGELRLLTTTKETYAQRIAQIPLSTLPRTFQETLTTARVLGIQYVWIDSLCIIQDDANDWERESSMMADIYGNSYITITAAASPDSTGGLFFGENHGGTGPFQVDRTLTRRLGSDIFVKELPYHGAYPAFGSVGSGKWLPTHNRAWVHQEYLLSPRVLQFGKSELRWDCGGGSSCCSFSGPPPRKNAREILLDAMFEPDPLTRQELVLQRWKREIKAYSRKALTVPSDKLPAFSGVARKFQPVLGPRYLAGMWETGLLSQLCWMATSPGKRPAEYRAPSFSWASVDGEIVHPLSELDIPREEVIARYQLSILDIYCDPASSDPTGSVRAGTLTVRGRVIQANYMRLPDDTLNATDNTNLDFRPDLRHRVVKDDILYTFTPDDETLVLDQRTPTVYCLRVAIFEWSPDYVPNAFIVLRVSESDPGCYERVGFSMPPSEYAMLPTDHTMLLPEPAVPAKRGLAFDEVEDIELRIV